MNGTCPKCKTLLGTPQGQTLQRAPRVGDIGLCAYCVSVLEYVADPKTGKPTIALWPPSRPIPAEFRPALEKALALAEADYRDRERAELLRARSPRDRAAIILGRN